jgi:hypothetical protein
MYKSIVVNLLVAIETSTLRERLKIAEDSMADQLTTELKLMSLDVVCSPSLLLCKFMWLLFYLKNEYSIVCLLATLF